MAIASAPTGAMAAGYWDTVVDNAAVVIDTALKNLTARQEVAMIRANWDKYYLTSAQANLPAVGQGSLAATYPVLQYSPEQLGTTLTLNYFFADPATGALTSPPFAVSSVEYEALLTPPTLNVNDLSQSLIEANLTVIGTSSDADNNFAASPLRCKGSSR